MTGRWDTYYNLPTDYLMRYESEHQKLGWLHDRQQTDRYIMLRQNKKNRFDCGSRYDLLRQEFSNWGTREKLWGFTSNFLFIVLWQVSPTAILTFYDKRDKGLRLLNANRWVQGLNRHALSLLCNVTRINYINYREFLFLYRAWVMKVFAYSLM